MMIRQKSLPQARSRLTVKINWKSSTFLTNKASNKNIHKTIPSLVECTVVNVSKTRLPKI